jgi:hypothetical protein
LRFEEMVRLAVDALEEEGSITLAGIPLTEHVASPDLTATIDISMGQRLGATTKFKPLRRADSSTAEAALWTVWDSTVQAVPDEYAAMLGNLLHQCDYYHEVGLPRLRDVGKAPFYGAMKGSGARLANELGASVGMTGEEFQALPIEERHRLYRIVGEGK